MICKKLKLGEKPIKKAILIHGFNKSKSDMKSLEDHLERQQLECISVNLPLTFEKIEHCAFIFEGIFEKIIQEMNGEGKISLIGHSSGGLVIRKFLSDTRFLLNVHKCVLIATPNNGTKLADYADKFSKPYTRIYKTLQSLRTKNIEALNLKDTEVDIGAIAGNKSDLLLGKLLNYPNDGRVEVDSVYYKGLKDFVVLPYGHKDIHYQRETADLIVNFIKNGKFR
ncbi:alpha/beta fold hydrolase [Brevibacillus fluminis]|uniref:alpha/beta fold hydrolase n=1 Tax=Brevibacillus fluminis TaxID=511487 RepID=UPI003F89D8EC